ncbi:MAG: hypothetical protein KKA67_07950 [Spirochaetes bacterium]|nr:hypothetical protein [Spirochaetota bacterium]MBU1079750.1 hypothetical protein [Spirochaetota bacterium]
MILVRAWTLALALALAVASTVGSAIWAYSLGVSGAKGDSETILFYGILAGAAETILGAALFSGARKKRRELDSLVDIARFSGAVPDERFRRFGPFGERIKAIQQELAMASERKGARIASLTGLLRASLELVDKPVLVASLDGRVVEASKGAKEDPRLRDLEIGSTPLSDVFPGIEPRAILQEADQTHRSVEREGQAVFHPIYSVRGEITHFMVDLSRNRALDFLDRIMRQKENGEEGPRRAKAGADSAGGGLLGFLRRRIAKKTP